MDFREAVIESLDRLMASDKVTKSIDAALEKCVTGVVADELRSYSDFGKRLTEAVKESLGFAKDFELPTYNHAIVQIVRRQVQSYVEGTIQQQVAKNLEELLAPVPESIKLSELVKAYRKQCQDQAEEGVSYGEAEITCRIDVSDHGFRYLSLDPNPDKKRFEAAITIGIYTEGRVFSLSFKNADVEKQMFVGPVYGFERMVFQMKAAQTRIELDKEPEELETHYGADL